LGKLDARNVITEKGAPLTIHPLAAKNKSGDFEESRHIRDNAIAIPFARVGVDCLRAERGWNFARTEIEQSV
jgi:hypothetical protein